MIDVPVVSVVQVPRVSAVKKTAETPQLQVVDVPVVLVMQAPLVQVMAKTVQIPKLPFIEKIAVIPEIRTVPGTRTSESANADSDHQAFMKGLITDFTEMEQFVFDGMFEHVEASMQQPHRCQEQQTVQGRRVEREKEKQGEKEKGVGEKRKKEKRELDGKEERRGTEGERVARKEGKENEVEKDVTGWTEVTRNKRKKMVQIFVKVDGMKTVAMEVSPEDKVQKILNTVSGSDQDVYVTSGGRLLRGSDKLKSCGVRDGSAVQVISRMRGGGKHKDKKGKEERKQVAQLDDGMCAMACEQMRQVMETLRTLADNSTGEDKRCVVEKVEELRKAIIGLRKQVRGEELQRVAELEESLKKLEEEMLLWSVEEQEQRRQEEQRRQGEQEEQRRQEEQEHAAMRKGKGKGNGGKGEHASRKGKFG